MKTFAALVTRERWEHPALWIVPAVLAALIVVMHVVGVVSMARLGVDAEEIRFGLAQVSLAEGAERRAVIQMALIGISVPFNFFLLGLMFFYSLGSLYDDRRDRSILFWKSLPVSDLETVMSKLATATLLAPALTLAVLAVLHVLTLLFGFAVGMWAGVEGAYLVLDPIVLVTTWAKLAWLLLAQSLILLPIVAWLMLASAWARKAPFLWALVPPVAVMIGERWMTGRSYLASWIGARFTEVWPMMIDTRGRGVSINLGPGGRGIEHAEVLAVSFDVLWSAQLWTGVAIAAALLAGAVWLRRYRADAE